MARASILLLKNAPPTRRRRRSAAAAATLALGVPYGAHRPTAQSDDEIFDFFNSEITRSRRRLRALRRRLHDDRAQPGGQLLPFNRENPRWALLPLASDQPIGAVDHDLPAKVSVGGTASDGQVDREVGGDATVGQDPTSTRPWRILLTGPLSNSLRYQSGGWTLHWQGASSDKPLERQGGETVMEAFLRLAPNGTRVHHTRGCDIISPEGQSASSVCTTTEGAGVADANVTLRLAVRNPTPPFPKSPA